MSKLEQHPITIRFLNVVDELIKRRVVLNQADFCKQMDYSVQSLSQIRVGKRNVTIDLIDKLFHRFNGNPIYLLSGSGNTILSEKALHLVNDPEAVYGKSEQKQPSVQTLEELVRSKDQIIELLKKEVARLEGENKTKKAKN